MKLRYNFALDVVIKLDNSPGVQKSTNIAIITLSLSTRIVLMKIQVRQFKQFPFSKECLNWIEGAAGKKETDVSYYGIKIGRETTQTEAHHRSLS